MTVVAIRITVGPDGVIATAPPFLPATTLSALRCSERLRDSCRPNRLTWTICRFTISDPGPKGSACDARICMVTTAGEGRQTTAPTSIITLLGKWGLSYGPVDLCSSTIRPATFARSLYSSARLQSSSFTSFRRLRSTERICIVTGNATPSSNPAPRSIRSKFFSVSSSSNLHFSSYFEASRSSLSCKAAIVDGLVVPSRANPLADERVHAMHAIRAKPFFI